LGIFVGFTVTCQIGDKTMSGTDAVSSLKMVNQTSASTVIQSTSARFAFHPVILPPPVLHKKPKKEDMGMNENGVNEIIESFPDDIKQKLKAPAAAFRAIKSGDRIFVGTACATPRTLIAELEVYKKRLDDVQMIHFLTDGAMPFKDGKRKSRFLHKVFFVGSDTLEAVKQGEAEYIPVSIARVPDLFLTGRIPLDVALIQVSLPDEHGFVSLGISVDIAHAAVLSSKTVIAEINPNMPRTLGDSFIPTSKIDHFVFVNTPITEYLHPPADEVAEKIARYAARIIQDNATLQIGLGRFPNEMLKYLSNRRNLGIHSDVITDTVIDLIEQGVVTGESKTSHKGKVVTSFCMGSARLYEKVNNNPMFAFYPIDYVCDPAEIKKNHQMVSVTQAFAIDLMGQVCSDQFDGEFYGGVSTQPDFIQGTAAAPGGKPIVCLPATTEDGKRSRIRSLLLEGEGVTIARSDIHYVITEYGSAYIFAKSIRERALALIEIAHPDFREDLLKDAKRLGYLRANLTLRSMTCYPEEEEKEVRLKSGEKLRLRPTTTSDRRGLQDIFYNLNPEDVYTRFFSKLVSLPMVRAESLCNVDYENEMAFVAVLGDMEKEIIVGSSCYFKDPGDNLAEVAYMIRPEWQGKGVGSVLQERMTQYAKSKGLSGFRAEILRENLKMTKLFQKGENIKVNHHGEHYEMVLTF
jgi:acyl-CoA hydrolase/GNAT superfamily N-acetyltransferase